jgi:hypothetical protein
MDVKTMKDHMSSERPLKDVVREKWMAKNATKYDSSAEANISWEEHWARVENFLGWLSEHTNPILV